MDVAADLIEAPGLDRVRAVVLPSRLVAEPTVRGRLERLRELGVDVVASASVDGPAAAADLLVGPEPVLVLSRSDGRGGVLAAPTLTAVVERPADALSVLDRLIEAQGTFPRPVEDPAWLVELEGFDAHREREVESWLAVGNGRIGTRGSLEEGSEHSEPGCYVAGVYGWPDREPPGPELVPGPEWTRLAPRVDTEPLEFARGIAIRHRRVLDLRQGILFRSSSWRLPSGIEAYFRSARFASLAERELLALEAELDADGWPAELDAAPGAVGGPAGTVGARERDGVLVVDVRGHRGGSARFALASESAGGRIERLVAVSRAAQGEASEASAEKRLARAQADGLAAVRARHRAAWRERWRGADVLVEGDPEAQRALRFALYHLISAADPESDLASVGARALTGSGYRGHVFWDTEAFVLPFFVFTHPETARALLGYRARTLPAARERARELGYRGALYAWESADTGEDVTPPYGIGLDGRRVPILTGRQEHHIVADVAWAAWRYWQATADEPFLAEAGGEILVETARFWAARARRGRDGRYHIARVIGPDEYHEGVRDNAFTNALARWNLERALELVERRSGPAGRLGLQTRELGRWRAVADGLHDGFDPRTGLYEQFAGFFELEDLRAAELAPRPFSPDAILGAERVRRSQLVKQADVVMLAHMLPELVPVEVARANYEYYEPRTSHGSSLSPAVHAAVAARIGKLEEALAYFRMAAAIDLSDAMGNSAQGIHIATMGALWQAAVFGFGGVQADGDALRLEPRLPAAWWRLAFPIRWRGTTIHLDARPNELLVLLDGPARLALGGAPARGLGAGRYRATTRAGRWSQLRKERP